MKIILYDAIISYTVYFWNFRLVPIFIIFFNLFKKTLSKLLGIRKLPVYHDEQI